LLRAADEDVVARAAEQHVAAAEADQYVVAGAALDDVGLVEALIDQRPVADCRPAWLSSSSPNRTSSPPVPLTTAASAAVVPTSMHITAAAI
jgi:hypothetical protein